MDRYAVAAPLYDVLSGERPIYRAGRQRAVSALQLPRGGVVLDLGCGTGLSLPSLASAVGPTGHIVAIDRSPQMLSRARRRAEHLACKVTLVTLDATHDGATGWDIVNSVSLDAVLFAYSLSVMRPWRAAWNATMRHTPVGARIAVLDMAVPHQGGPLWRAVAGAGAWLGRADLTAHPWEDFQTYAQPDFHCALKGGHVRVTAGRRVSAP